MLCQICEQIKNSQLKTVYEDEKIIAVLAPKPAITGHIIIMPKAHYPIIEQIPDYIIAHLFTQLNKISTSVFEILQAEGTNIIVQNGVAAGQKTSHFMVHLIPRIMNDGLNFQWQPKQLTEEQMSTIELKLKEQTKNIGQFEQEEKEPVKLEPEKETISEAEDYRLKQLRKIP